MVRCPGDIAAPWTADVTVSRSGAVHVCSGGTSLGQGIETVLGQIAADALGADPRSVRVTAGDTAAQPFGAGSWASRSTVVGGSAVHQAALAVRRRAIELAARVLEAAEEDLDLAGGTVSVRGDPAAGLTLAGVIILVIILPYFGVFIYLIAEHSGMAERNTQQLQAQQAVADQYIRSVSGSGGPASEIERAKSLLDSGAITQAEYDSLKAKALGHS